jgi:hypothetical protein
MKRYIHAVAAAAILTGGLGSAGCANTGSSGCGNQCANRDRASLEDRYRNAADVSWPDRYNFAARESLTAPFAQQAATGHFIDQTLWNWYFVPGTEKLTQGGFEKLDSLCRATPSADPRLYIQTARDIVMTEWFKLSDQSFEALRREKVPEALLMKLAALKNKALREGDFRTEIADIFKALDADEKTKLNEKDKYLFLILKYSSMTPETVAAFREELNARRAATIKNYMTSQPGAPVAYEVYVHDAPVPGIHAPFITGAFNGQKAGYKGGINQGASGGGTGGGSAGQSAAPLTTVNNVQSPSGGGSGAAAGGATSGGSAPSSGPSGPTGSGAP